METTPSQPEKKGPGSLSDRMKDAAVFTVRDNDWMLVKFFKYLVNYTMFGFVMFMTAVVWFIAILAA